MYTYMCIYLKLNGYSFVYLTGIVINIFSFTVKKLYDASFKKEKYFFNCLMIIRIPFCKRIKIEYSTIVTLK